MRKTLALLALMAPGLAHAAECRVPLFDPADPVEEAWTRHDFVGRSSFRNVETDRGPAILAQSSGASGLYHEVVSDVAATPVARWRWRVDSLQPSADVRRTATEDFSAVIFFVFGEPSLFRRNVPTLAYAWTATPVPLGTAVPSPRHPSTRVTVKLRGAEAVGGWAEEERDLLADYRAAFGSDPREPLRYVAIFSDDDQTREKASALYGAVELVGCAG